MTSDPIREMFTDMVEITAGSAHLLHTHVLSRFGHTPLGMAEDAPATAAEDFTGIVANEGGTDASTTTPSGDSGHDRACHLSVPA